MKCKKVISIISMLLSLILLCCSTTAFASPVSLIEDNYLDSQEIYTKDEYKVEYFEDGSKLEIITGTMKNSARGAIVRRNIRSNYLDSSGNVLCSFTIYGDFNTTNGECVNSFHSSTASAEEWKVENASSWHNTKIVYGTCDFVRRILGIKIKVLPQKLELFYQ